MPTPYSISDARANIQALTNADAWPKLRAEQVDFLVADSARKDSAGREPTDTGWTPSYDLAAGVSKGWAMKAGNVACNYDISSNDQKLSRSQVIANCMEMSQYWQTQMEAETGKALTYENLTVEQDEWFQRGFDYDLSAWQR